LIPPCLFIAWNRCIQLWHGKSAGPAELKLRAIIADGTATIQSLQVDQRRSVFFYQSALGCGAQWRYRPTVLNGEAVEIDYVSSA